MPIIKVQWRKVAAMAASSSSWWSSMWIDNAVHPTLVSTAKMSDSPREVLEQLEKAIGETSLGEAAPAELAAAAPLSKNQLKNAAKKDAKLEKYAAKLAKQQLELEAARAKSKEASEEQSKRKASGEEREAVAVDTPPGEKKTMTSPMAKAYDPKAVESAWYSWWQKEGFFKPEYKRDDATNDAERPVFTMILPPPNVTGSLHLGHAMMGSIEDCIARWHRMQGHSVLFLPGCDHAGIATQAVVEKKLKRERNTTRHDIGREAFVAEVWKWKDQYGSRIYEQLKRMGLSLDWDRARFTMDQMSNVAVNEAFCRLFDEGLIFRANRLVNWSGRLKTALSDLEVDMREIGPRTMLPAYGHDPKHLYPFGLMWSFAYRVEGHGAGEEAKEEIVISTTRPETLFGDTAVAVHPADPRYTHLHGQRVVHPITGKSIPIICDDIADPSFGTGALKISPAHDPVDFQVGHRHRLAFVSIFDEDNRLNGQCGAEYAGMQRYDARLKVIEDAKARGAFRGEQDHPMVLPICSRSGDFVEPRMMPQWWLNCQSMADRSLKAVQDGVLKIVPEDQVKVWNNWLGNIRDWCLSRQLWWGHQVPAYQVCVASQPLLDAKHEPVWVVGRTEEEARGKAKRVHPEATVVRDPDVLDTWFSSGLWPFSTLGWPNETHDLGTFYPNTLLETGSDILFFWVARMVMLGVHLTGKVPFSSIFLHSIVRDAHGRKMSKSLGNVIDPIDVIEGITLDDLHASLVNSNLEASEVDKAKAGQKLDFPQGIPECGTDALRFALCSYVSHGRDVNMNVREVHAYRRFCNKLWQVCSFALHNLGPGFKPDLVLTSLSPIDKWILGRLNETIAEVNAGFESYVLMNVTRALHSFWLNDICDVYIEAIKPVIYDNEDAAGRMAALQCMYRCIHDGLLLLHPMMPFVTEELFQRLRTDSSPVSVCIARYPERVAVDVSEQDSASTRILFEMVKEIRSLVADNKQIPLGTLVHMSCEQPDVAIAPSLSGLVRSVGKLEVGGPLPDGAPLLQARLASSPHVQVRFYPKPVASRDR